jgi:enoyl-CoA hydratase/carnithine racemase
MPEDLSKAWSGLVSRPRLEDYAERFKDYFVFTRRDGILEVRMHTDGGPFLFTYAAHNAWAQAWHEIGNDPENEVIIITGTGDQWHGLGNVEMESGPTDDEQIKLAFDAVKLLENLVFGIDVPTIAAVNGPTIAHTEFAFACDLTICAESATFWDPHFVTGAAPGDGLGLTLQELFGTKRAAYYMYTSKQLDAHAALELGLVNEVLPADQLVPRAWELAELIMQQPKATRRMTHAIVTRPWKQRLTADLGFHVYHEMWGNAVAPPVVRVVPPG